MAHHGAAYDDGILTAGGEATLLKYMGYGRAQWHPVITRLWNIAAGHCDDPLYERLTQANGFTNGEGGAYVVHYYPKLRRNGAGRHFLPGNDLDQLLFTAGRYLVGITVILILPLGRWQLSSACCIACTASGLLSSMAIITRLGFSSP